MLTRQNIHIRKNNKALSIYGIVIIIFYIFEISIRIHRIKEINVIDIISRNNLIYYGNSTSFNIYDFCSQPQSSCLPPFIDISEEFVRKIVTVPKYKLLNCVMPKCFSTTTTKVFSYLYDPVKYQTFEWNHNGISSTSHENDYSSVENFLQNTQTRQDELKNWRMSVFIREPLDRFISAFINKCYIEREYISPGLMYPGKELCYGCQRNLTCFMLEQYKRSYMYGKRWTKFTSYEDQHTYPQNWFCNFRKFKNHYKIYKTYSDRKGIEDYNKNILEMLEKRNIDDKKIKYIEDNILMEFSRKKRELKYDIVMKYIYNGVIGDIENYHQLPVILKNEILSTPLLYKTFISTYYQDYLQFSFIFPKPNFTESHITF
uniref:Sulfotransfer_1 domain-containing protein n=1 Tax=Strongyloides papillosus TaxID=174720 RepID=A0A0N5BIM6_STREA